MVYKPFPPKKLSLPPVSGGFGASFQVLDICKHVPPAARSKRGAVIPATTIWNVDLKPNFHF